MTQIAFGTPELRITDAELQQELEEEKKRRLTDQRTPEELAESWGLGQIGSEAARQSPRVRFDRRESRPYFAR